MCILALRTRQDRSRSGVLKKGRAAVGCRERVYKKKALRTDFSYGCETTGKAWVQG